MSPSQVPSSASDPQPAASREQPTENVAALNAGNTVTIVGAASRAAELLAAGSYPALAAGMQIDAYQLQKKLGEGGMGTVWVALHTKLDKLVALKVLPAQLARDANAISRFEREMVAIGKLEHPHIVRAMDAGEVGGAPFLVMEFADGKDLAALVKTRGPRKLLDAYVMIWQAALALGYIHRHGLVHRDVKPSNLLLTKQGKIKLLDLGMARLLSEISAGGLTAIGQVVGTPDYMAPEQWDNSHAVDGRADLYALGCTLFYLLTGRGPYGDEQHNSMSRKMKGHILEPIPSLVAIRPDVPPEVDAIYRKLMAKEPNERFGTAEELIPALTPIIKQAVAARAGRGSVSGSAPSSDSNSSSISISGFLPAAVAALTAATPAAPAETPVATDLVNSVPPSLPAASAEPASTTLGRRRAGRLWAIAGAALLAVAIIVGIAVLLL